MDESEKLIKYILNDYESVSNEEHLENLMFHHKDKLKGYNLYEGIIRKGDSVKYITKHGKLFWGGYYIKTKEKSILVKNKFGFYDVPLSNYIFVKKKYKKEILYIADYIESIKPT